VSGKKYSTYLQSGNINAHTDVSPRWGFVLTFHLIFYHIAAATLLLKKRQRRDIMVVNEL